MKRMSILFLVAACGVLTACGGGDPESDVVYVDNPLYPASPGDFVGPPAPRQ